MTCTLRVCAPVYVDDGSAGLRLHDLGHDLPGVEHVTAVRLHVLLDHLVAVDAPQRYRYNTILHYICANGDVEQTRSAH